MENYSKKENYAKAPRPGFREVHVSKNAFKSGFILEGLILDESILNSENRGKIHEYHVRAYFNPNSRLYSGVAAVRPMPGNEVLEVNLNGLTKKKAVQKIKRQIIQYSYFLDHPEKSQRSLDLHKPIKRKLRH